MAESGVRPARSARRSTILSRISAVALLVNVMPSMWEAASATSGTSRRRRCPFPSGMEINILMNVRARV